LALLLSIADVEKKQHIGVDSSPAAALSAAKGRKLQQKSPPAASVNVLARGFLTKNSRRLNSLGDSSISFPFRPGRQGRGDKGLVLRLCDTGDIIARGVNYTISRIGAGE
jgi:hypothetical protein